MRMIRKLFGILLVCMIFSQAHAATPTLIFTSEPTASDIAPGDAQTLVYTVKNTVPTAPQPINSLTVTLASGSAAATNVVTDSCNNLIPAGGTCNISVRVTAGQNAGTVNETLHIIYGGRGTDLTAPINFSISGSQPTPTLVYTQQPTSPQTINSGDSTTLTYNITNTSTVAAVYTPSTSSSANYLSATISSDPCNGHIAPSQTCVIKVDAIAQPVTSTESDSVDFSVTYGYSAPTIVLPASPVEFSIVPGSANLSFVPPNPQAPNLAPGQQGSALIFTLSNTSGAAIPFTAAATSSPYDTSVVSNSCSGSVPANGTCTVSVTLTADSDIAVSTTVQQALNITYEGTKHLAAPLSYTITVNSSTALTFSSLASPSTVSLLTNTQPSTPSFVYTVQNSSSAPIPIQVSTPNSVTASDTISFTNSCNGIVPASGTCNINVFVVTTNTPTSGAGTAHNLDVFFGPNYSYQIGQIPVFNVQVTPSNNLTFSLASAPNSQIIGGAQQTLLYKVQNNNPSNSITLSNITLTNAADNTGTSTTGIIYTSIPMGDTPCYNGNAFATLGHGDYCDLNVQISAPIGSSTAGNVTQYLSVTSNTPTITQPLIYSVITSALSFVAEPTPQNVAVGHTETLEYGIHNSDSSNPITFNAAGVSFGAYPGLTPQGASLFSASFTNSCNGSIPPNANCSITAVITPISSGAVQNLALIIPNNASQTLISSTFPINFRVTNNSVANRTLTFVNNCPSTTVWVGLNGGGANNVSSTSGPPNPHIVSTSSSICNNNADCPNGSSCVTTNVQTNTKLCFWNNVSPSGGFALATGATSTIELPEYTQIAANDKNIVWSGNVTGRLGCSTSGLCTSADCTGAPTTLDSGNNPDSTNACFPGIGATPPNTLAEFTFSRTSPDFYDDSIINGTNIPVSMRPTTLTSYQNTQHANNGYICGEAGKTTATSNGPGAASWAFTAPNSPSTVTSTQYIAVVYDSTAPTCTSSSICTSPDICGLTFNPTTNSFQQKCGKFNGYWTGDQICGTNNGSGADPGFNCQGSAGMSSPFASLTISNLYKCDQGLPSCYASGTTPGQCCGGVNWDNVPSVGALVPAAPLVQAIANTNPSWNSNIQSDYNPAPPTPENNLAWLKAAVPSAYTFPFDDPSSTFTCPNCATAAGQPAGIGCSIPNTEFNTSDYTITFCPAGTLIPTPT